MFLVRRLVFHLVRCFSSGACGFGQLPLPQVACLWVLPPYAWPASEPAALVGLQPSPCVLSASPAPAGLLGFAGFLHPVSGCSHEGCECSLGGSVGVPYDYPFLSSFVSYSVFSSCGSHPLWVLCSVHCLVSLALGWVRFRPAVSSAPVRCGVCCLGCPSWLVLPLRSLLALHLLLRWGGLVTRLWPLLLLLSVRLW